MPIMRMKDIQEASKEELKKRLMELRTELARQKTMVEAGGAIENPSKIRELKRTIARIYTVMDKERREVK